MLVKPPLKSKRRGFRELPSRWSRTLPRTTVLGSNSKKTKVSFFLTPPYESLHLAVGSCASISSVINHSSAVWLKGTWCSGLVSGLSFWDGRAEIRTLDHKRPPDPTSYQLARALPETSVSMLRRSSTQQPASSTAGCPVPNNSKTGTQHYPLAERLPKIILGSQTPQNTPQDSALPTRKTRYTSTQQNTGTTPLQQETYTTHWTNLTPWGQTPKSTGTMNLQHVKRTPQTQ